MEMFAYTFDKNLSNARNVKSLRVGRRMVGLRPEQINFRRWFGKDEFHDKYECYDSHKRLSMMLNSNIPVPLPWYRHS